MNSVELEFRSLCINAAKSSFSGSSTTDFEHTFVSVLKYIQDHIEQKGQLEFILVEMLDDPDIDAHELLAFCMHALRWEGVRREIFHRVGIAKDWRLKTSLSRILEAYDDDWSARDLYEYYSNEDVS